MKACPTFEQGVRLVTQQMTLECPDDIDAQLQACMLCIQHRLLLQYKLFLQATMNQIKILQDQLGAASGTPMEPQHGG